MKKFKFRLTRLLEVRRQAEKVRKQRLAAIQRDIERESEMLKRLIACKNHIMDELRMHGLQETLDIASVMDCQYRLQVITEHIRMRNTAICGLRQEESLKRKEVIVARRDRKVVENLRGRAYARYLQEGVRLEQRFLDEIGLVQYMKEGGDKTNEWRVLG